MDGAGVSATWRIVQGDALERLRELSTESVQCCITSPPYFGLRDYGTGEWEGGQDGCDHRSPTMREDRAKLAGSVATNSSQLRLAQRLPCGKCGARRTDRQLGLEPTPDEYVARLVEVFREVRRVLRADGTLWLNCGDSYHGGGYANHRINGDEWLHAHGGDRRRSRQQDRINANPNLKPKDLIGIPWLLAFALRADSWYLRSDIIWNKPNPMPESVTDRPTSAHEHVFLLAKSPRYFYDADAIRESHQGSTLERYRYGGSFNGGQKHDDDGTHWGDQFASDRKPAELNPAGRNRRNVWEIATQPYPEAHFATFPTKLVEPCVLAGTSPGSVILDPFTGSGTVGVVALRHDRSFIGIELSPTYCEMARERICGDAPLLNTGLEAVA